MNLALKRNAEYLIKIFQPISEALDKIQSNTCNIAKSVLIFKRLQIELAEILGESQIEVFRNRYQMAMSPYHFTAFLLSPSMKNQDVKLTSAEKKIAMEMIEDEFSINFMPLFFKFYAGIEPFQGPIFNKQVLESLDDTDWWKSMHSLYDNLYEGDFIRIQQFLTATASSSGVERIFSKFGLVHTKLRNRLGIEKAAKLTFINTYINSH